MCIGTDPQCELRVHVSDRKAEVLLHPRRTARPGATRGRLTAAAAAAAATTTATAVMMLPLLRRRVPSWLLRSMRLRGPF